MYKPTKAEVMREARDYIFITLGLFSYALGWAAFLIPYQITTGGTTGIGAIIYYATGFPIQWSYFIINAVLLHCFFKLFFLLFYTFVFRFSQRLVFVYNSFGIVNDFDTFIIVLFGNFKTFLHFINPVF